MDQAVGVRSSPETDVAAVRVRDLSHAFVRDGRVTRAIHALDLDVSPGRFVAFVGPSGCGKSTLLNLISGLIRPTSGEILLRERPVTGPCPELGYLTQKDSLLPWRNLLSNTALPLEIRRVPKKERHDRARQVLDRVGLRGFESHMPHELSGGMLRRACLARMLCGDPEVLLLDEPFGALDAQLRLDLQNELLGLWQGSSKTVLFVTHDLEEAVALADRVVVFASPARIVADVEIGLARPRDAMETRFEPKFREIHESLWATVTQIRKAKP